MKRVEEFLEYIKENPNVAAEFDSIVSKAKLDNPNGIDEDTRSAVIETEILPLAKKYGFELTKEDFEMDNEVSIEEADSVAGGALGCVCAFAGGGSGTEDGISEGNLGKKTYGCACVGYGQGGNGDANDCNCFCTGAGTGADERNWFKY